MTIGFIKLHRQFLKWEWYDDINVKVLFLHCLFRANWEDQKWHGELIPRGSFVTSLQNLAKETHLSIQQTRTALKKLSATNEITHEQHGSNSMITVNNYNRFQNSNMEVTRSQIEFEQKNKNFNSEITHEQHGSNSMITTKNQDDFRDNNKQITSFQQTNNKRVTTIEEVKKERNTSTTTTCNVENFQKIYGKYNNVCLTAEQYNRLLAKCASQKLLDELIDSLSAKVETGKEQPFKADFPNAHYVRLEKYFEWRRKHPTRPTTRFNGGIQQQIDEQAEMRKLAAEWAKRGSE